MRVAASIMLTDEERTTLTKWAGGRSTPARLVQRGQIVLAAAEGRENRQIAAELCCARRSDGTWRNRFAADRLVGIERGSPRSGRTPTTRAAFEAEIICKTTQETPANATPWSTRSLAKELGCDDALVRRVWRDNGLQRHRTKSFKVSNDPQFAEKLVEVVGLCLDPPEHALVLSCDEKSQIQALDRTQESLPLFPGRLKTLTHDDKHNGTATLFAARFHSKFRDEFLGCAVFKSVCDATAFLGLSGIVSTTRRGLTAHWGTCPRRSSRERVFLPFRICVRLHSRNTRYPDNSDSRCDWYWNDQ